MLDNYLIKEALKARELSYSPYSHFKVGAALLTKDGQIYLGANIENSSYPLSMCAERNTLYNAYMHEVKKEDIISLAIVGDTIEPISPCGACRQVMSELMPNNAKIIMSNLKGDVLIKRVDELLPLAFKKEDLK